MRTRFKVNWLLLALVAAAVGGVYSISAGILLREYLGARAVALAVLIICAAFFSMNAVFAPAVAVVGRILGARIESISIGSGAEIVGLTVGDTKLRIALFFLSGFTKFASEGERPFLSLHPAARALIALTGPAATVAAAAIVMGPQAVNETWRFIPQTWDLFVHSPRPSLIGSILRAEQENGFLFATALVTTKIAGFNLLPVPVLCGGAFLECVIEMLTGHPLPEKLQRIGVTIGVVLLVSFAIVIGIESVRDAIGLTS